MKNLIIFEKEVDAETEKFIKKHLRKINNSLRELSAAGYNMYLTPNSLNVCDGETHSRRSGHDSQANKDTVVASIYVSGIDAGDW